MTMKLYSDTDIQAIANAIRTKNGSSDTYTVSEMAQAITDIPAGGGGISTDDIASGIIGKDITINVPTVKTYAFFGTDVENVILDGVSTIDKYAFTDCKSLKSVSVINTDHLAVQGFVFQGCNNLETFNHPYYTTVGERDFNGCEKLKSYFVFDGDGIWTETFKNCKELLGVDCGTRMNGTRANMFNGCISLSTLILRNNYVCALVNVSAFTNTPFASGKAGGDIYIPKYLYDHLGDGTALDYQSATNWATVHGYGTITWHPIEGSQYEHYYIDGTPIHTRTAVSFTRIDGRNYNTTGGYGVNQAYFSTDFIQRDNSNIYEFVSKLAHNSTVIKVQEFNGDTFLGMAWTANDGKVIIDGEEYYRFTIILQHGGDRFRFCHYPNSTIDTGNVYLYKITETEVE